LHAGDESLAEIKHAAQVYIHHRVVIFQPHIQELQRLGDAGVVHQNIDLAECFRHLRRRFMAAFEFCDVAGKTVMTIAISAAADGLGVALESTLLAERELQTGRLVCPLRGSWEDVNYIGHFLAFPRSQRRQRAFRLFLDWIKHELQIT
jgi:DNA-binding transcriptional LysR family regulator